ncbi:MAG: FAD-binding oxidoreductase [Gemmatimonadota bacterium]|nr:FAD-binding oxidoreductase [Gemmatimonadota bacterium]
MVKVADAVVIGGGIMGASAAHFLAKKGLGAVVLLEKRSLAAVSTGHSAAVIRTFYSNDLTIRLSMKALEMFANGREALGGDCGFRNTGYICLLGEHTAAAGLAVLEAEQRNHTRAVEVETDQIAELVPGVNTDGIVSGIYEPLSGYADPVKTVRNLVTRAAEWGLTCFEGVGVTRIRLSGDRVTGVETDAGEIQTDLVINAAGPWGRRMGLSAGLNYSLRWSRESDLVLRLPEGFGRFPVVSDPNLRIYFRPDGENGVLAGLSFPKEVEPMDVDAYDPDLDEPTRRRIESGTFERVPPFRRGEYLKGWASVYTITDDWHPLVGPEPGLEGYYAFFGGSGHGFKLGPPIADSLSDVILGRTPAFDLHPFRPSRFLEGEQFSSAWGGGNRG